MGRMKPTFCTSEREGTDLLQTCRNVWGLGAVWLSGACASRLQVRACGPAQKEGTYLHTKS
jgi:hypothetical protein